MLVLRLFLDDFIAEKQHVFHYFLFNFHKSAFQQGPFFFQHSSKVFTVTSAVYSTVVSCMLFITYLKEKFGLPYPAHSYTECVVFSSILTHTV